MPHESSSGNGTNKGDGDKMLAPKRISISTLVLPNTGPTAKDYIQDENFPKRNKSIGLYLTPPPKIPYVKDGLDGSSLEPFSLKTSKKILGLYLVSPLPLNPYVREGLVAMWDGIWNAGFGIHYESATIWKDLIGEKDVTLSPNGSFSENALVCSGLGYAASDGSTFTKEDIKTIEIVFDGERTSSGILMVASGFNVNRSQIVSIGGNYLFTMNVSSSSAGLKNRCPIPSSGKVSASLLYSDTDFVKSVVNGTEASVDYSFRSLACNVICFGGRSQNTDVPFSGSIFSVRLYNRLLSDEEIAQNYSVDQRRFNIP